MTKEERDDLAKALQFEADRHRDIGPITVTRLHEGVATQRSFRDAIRLVREHRVAPSPEVERLKALLREVEWREEDGMSCLFCGAVHWRGHAPDCRLKAAIG